MDALVDILFKRLMDEARKAVKRDKVKTLAQRHIEVATRIVLRGELAKLGVTEANRAVTKSKAAES